jgi:cell wall-associated NlpC family hydrolase
VPYDVRQLLGIPWEQCNCWRLVARAYILFWGIKLPTYDAADPDDRKLVAHLIETGRSDWGLVGEAEFGDVLLFREDQMQPTHVAMAIDAETMLHVRRGQLSQIAWWDDSYRGRMWRPRLCGIYRHDALALASFPRL